MTSNIDVIQLFGILDEPQGQQLRQMVSDLIKEGRRTILLDCADVEFIDSAGLGALTTVLTQIRSRGGYLALCGTNEQVKLLFELTNINKLFEVFSSPEVFYQSILRQVLRESHASAWAKRAAPHQRLNQQEPVSTDSPKQAVNLWV